MNSLSDMTALGVNLKSGAISASVLLDHHLSAIRLHQSDLNCFLSVDEAAAKRDAATSDARLCAGAPLSPIDGIPMALKDNIHVDGMVTRNGTLLEFSFSKEADVTKRLRAAGAVILGKLNMDECALGATTDNPHHNRTHNPWRIGHTPGGSSGGAGAAVAGGLVMAALGTDTLGSVRLPSAYCGIVGLKPTLGLINTHGVVTLSTTLDHVGPLCLSVRDAALLLNILAGPTPENWTCEANAISDLKDFRIGVFDQIKSTDLTQDVVNGFERVKTDLEDHGATLVSVSIPELNFTKLRRAAFLIIEAEGATALAKPLQTHPEKFSAGLKEMFDYGHNAPREKIDDARNYLAKIKLAEPRIFSDIDFLVSPTAPQTAFSFKDPAPSNQADLTALANICGGPAITLPSGLDTSGLPLAVQLMAPAYQESKMLSAAMFLESIWGTLSPDRRGRI